MRNSTIIMEQNLNRVSALLRQQGAMSTPDVADTLQLGRSTTRTYLQTLRDRDLVHISTYVLRHRKWTPLYAHGTGDDAPAPVRNSNRYRPRKGQGEQGPTVVNVRRDPLVAALFGPANVV